MVKTIVFFGDSLTAGYGVQSTQSFVSLLENKINTLFSNYRIINAGVSGDTTKTALERLPRILQHDFDIFVIGLGANDMLRFQPAQNIQNNLQEIITQTRRQNPKTEILLLGMELPKKFTLEPAIPYQNIYKELSESNAIPLVPCILQDVFGKPNYNLQDRIHPNAKGYELIAKRIWPELFDLLQQTNI